MEKKLRAIVVDDMDFCRDLLTEFLTDRGYQVLSFADVTSFPLFPARNIDCPKNAACADFFLTDNRMPHMQGIDFLELLAQSKCLINTARKAIFSAHWSQEDREKATLLNCKTFDKPYNLDALGTWLDSQEKLIPRDRPLVELDIAMTREKQKN